MHMGSNTSPYTASAPSSSESARVLVADDNPVNRTVAAIMLEKLGCRPSLSADGAEAVQMHADQAYDLILMDCEMPEVDGYEATARIRQAEHGQHHTPIIALTSSTMPTQREKCLTAGMDDFLPKPVELSVLQEMLRRWLPQVAAVNTDKLNAMLAAFGDEEFAALVNLYQNESPKRIEAMRRAIAGNELTELARLAHAFSGSCASMGAAALCAMCKALEARAKDGTPAFAEFDRHVAEIATEYERVSAQLRSKLATLP
jgi:CheY-like chemotaxis protein